MPKDIPSELYDLLENVNASQEELRSDIQSQQCSTVERLISAKQQAISDMQYELYLLQRDAFDLYQKIADYFPFSHLLLPAYHWTGMKRTGKYTDGNKLKPNKKYPEKVAFNDLEKQLSRILNVSDLVLQNVIDYNYRVAWIAEFTCNGYAWQLTVPNADKISFDYYEKNNKECFQLKLSCADLKRNSFWYVIGYTFNVNKLASFIPEGILRMQREDAQSGTRKRSRS